MAVQPARRIQGLRREELAVLAGVSVDYIVRLEQGRSAAPSAQVLDALSRALELTGAERNHLYRLAGLAEPAEAEIVDELSPALRLFLDKLGDTAAAAFAADYRIIWWNANWAALLGDPSPVAPEMRNFARQTFPLAGDGPRITQWPVTSQNPDLVEAAVVGELRRATGRFPHSERLTALIDLLVAGNSRFAGLWASGTVGSHQDDRKVVQHPELGPVTVDCSVLTEDESSQKIVLVSPAAGPSESPRLSTAHCRRNSLRF